MNSEQTMDMGTREAPDKRLSGKGLLAAMTCPMCAYGGKLNLSKPPGFEQCEVSYKDGKATLVCAAGVKPNFEQMGAAVTEYGFTPGDATVTVSTD